MKPPRRAPDELSLARVRVRPTGRGAQVLFVGVSSLVVALSLGTTQFYQLAYALLGLFVAAYALGLATSRSLGLERRISRDAGIAAGESATIGLRLSNDSRRAASGVEVVDRLPQRSVYRFPEIPGGEERSTQTTVSFARRGLYAIGSAEIASTDPFGLLRFRRKAAPETEMLVYPEVHETPGLPVRDAEEAGGRIQPASRGDELSGLRDYRPGDDRRFIHWKSVARTGELVVKEFAPDAPRRYSVVLNLRASPAGAEGQELEDAVSAAASVVSHLDRAGFSYRLRLTDRTANSTSFETSAGEGSYHAAMRLLAVAQADGGVEIGEALREELSEGRPVEGVILIERGTPGAARREELAEALRELSSRGLAVVVVLISTHTYTPGGDRDALRETQFAELVRELELSGAAVLVVRRETGAAGLSPAVGGREAV